MSLNMQCHPKRAPLILLAITEAVSRCADHIVLQHTYPTTSDGNLDLQRGLLSSRSGATSAFRPPTFPGACLRQEDTSLTYDLVMTQKPLRLVL